MKSRPDSNSQVPQRLGKFLAVMPGQEGNGARLMGAGKHPAAQFFQSGGAGFRLKMLPPSDILHPFPLKIGQPLGQSRDSRHIQRPRLQPLRQIFRHILPDRIAAGAAHQQRLPFPAAEENSGALGTKEALMPRHGNKISPQFL